MRRSRTIRVEGRIKDTSTTTTGIKVKSSMEQKKNGRLQRPLISSIEAALCHLPSGMSKALLWNNQIPKLQPLTSV